MAWILVPFVVHPHHERLLVANGVVALEEVNWVRQHTVSFRGYMILGLPSEPAARLGTYVDGLDSFANNLIGPVVINCKSLFPGKNIVAPFKYRRRSDEFGEAFRKQIADDFDRARDTLVSRRNAQRLYHGRKWRTKPVEHGDEEGELKSHSFEFLSPFIDVMNHDLQKLISARWDIVDGMMTQFAASLYETISRSTEKSGNVVVPTVGQTPAETFLATLEKIEFGIDEEGNVSVPEFHMGREAFEKTMASLKAQGPEFEERIERIKAEKFERAKQREKERIDRFPAAWEN